MDKNIEIRAFNFEVRAEENEEHGHFLNGRAIVYNSPTDLGWYEETIADGALAGTDMKDVRFLVNHNTDMIPLARSRNNNANSTMQLSVLDGEGMDIRADLDIENNSDAKSLWSATNRGDISGMSFMFTVDGEEWTDIDTDYPKRNITKIGKIFEVSAVTFPAYEATSLEARGMSGALDNARAALDSVKAERRKLDDKKKKIKILLEI